MQMTLRYSVSVLMLSFLLSCGSTQERAQMDLARLVERDGRFCLYENRGQEFFLVGDDCANALDSSRKKVILREGVHIAAKDFSNAINILGALLDKSSCDDDSGHGFVVCFRDDLPNMVSKDGGLYRFWYGHFVSSDVGGVYYVMKRDREHGWVLVSEQAGTYRFGQ